MKAALHHPEPALLICCILVTLPVSTFASWDGTLQRYDPETTRRPNHTSTISGKCQLLANEKVHEQVLAALDRETKLIVYDIDIDGYDKNPLLQGMTTNYKANIWYRSSSKHGLALLNLAFNYHVLSMSMLTFGVEEMSVTLKGVCLIIYT